LDIIAALIVVLLAGILLYSIFTGKMPSGKGGGGIASLTAFHDFQPKDKQEAMEVIVDENAGKRRFEISNDKPKEREGLGRQKEEKPQ